MKKYLLATFASVTFVGTTFASTWNETNGKLVSGVQVMDNGNFVITFTTTAQSYCTQFGSNSIYFAVGQNSVTADGIKSLLATALTALSAGMIVDVVHDNDPGGYCFGRYLKARNS